MRTFCIIILIVFQLSAILPIALGQGSSNQLASCTLNTVVLLASSKNEIFLGMPIFNFEDHIIQYKKFFDSLRATTVVVHDRAELVSEMRTRHWRTCDGPEHVQDRLVIILHGHGVTAGPPATLYHLMLSGEYGLTQISSSILFSLSQFVPASVPVTILANSCDSGGMVSAMQEYASAIKDGRAVGVFTSSKAHQVLLGGQFFFGFLGELKDYVQKQRISSFDMVRDINQLFHSVMTKVVYQPQAWIFQSRGHDIPPKLKLALNNDTGAGVLTEREFITPLAQSYGYYSP